MLPPPGLYGGVILLGAGALDFVDGKGKTIPALRDAHLAKELAGPFLYYVPETKVLGGSIGFGAIFPAGNQCGHLFIGDSNRDFPLGRIEAPSPSRYSRNPHGGFLSGFFGGSAPASSRRPFGVTTAYGVSPTSPSAIVTCHTFE